MAEHNILGAKGEELAASFLENNGHVILARNFRHGKAEIDIISSHVGQTVFCEVKTRSSDYFGYPEESVDKKKRKKIKLAAEEFMYQQKMDTEMRFDIIAIVAQNGKMDIHHFKDAFFNEPELYQGNDDE